MEGTKNRMESVKVTCTCIPNCGHFWSCHLQKDLAERKGLREEQQERSESASTGGVRLGPDRLEKRQLKDDAIKRLFKT